MSIRTCTMVAVIGRGRRRRRLHLRRTRLRCVARCRREEARSGRDASREGLKCSFSAPRSRRQTSPRFSTHDRRARPMAESATPQPPPPPPPPPKWTDVAISNVAVVVILIALFFAYLCTHWHAFNRYQKLADRYRLPADADADSEWRLATDITGDQPLKVHTRVRAGELSFLNVGDA